MGGFTKSPAGTSRALTVVAAATAAAASRVATAAASTEVVVAAVELLSAAAVADVVVVAAAAVAEKNGPLGRTFPSGRVTRRGKRCAGSPLLRPKSLA